MTLGFEFVHGTGEELELFTLGVTTSIWFLGIFHVL